MFVLFLVIALVAYAIGAYASGPIKIIVNGQEINTDAPPQIIDDRTMVPLRAVSEALGAEVNWDSNTQSVNISFGMDEEAEYNAFVAEVRDKLNNFKVDSPIIINGQINPDIYIKLQQLSRSYDEIINKAMLIHPPRSKAPRE